MSQKIVAKLDTQRSAYENIGNVNVMDSVELELQISSNNFIDEAWINPEFELLGHKKDHNDVRQKEGFEIISKTEHTLKVILNDQFVACRGLTELQLIIKDNGRTSTTVFYLNVNKTLDDNIIQSIRDVKVLDDLEKYVEKGFNDLDDFEQRMILTEQKMKETNDLMIESEKTRELQENSRKLSEDKRNQDENIRENNERDRVNKEDERVLSETKRHNDESTRIEAERSRIANENKRIEDESKREAAEGLRETNYERKELERDNKYSNAESSRNTSFNQSELARTQSFNQSEDNRQISENKRVQTEKTRENSESTRSSNETIRKSNETKRVDAELERQTSFNELYDRGNKVISDVENATDEIVGARTDYMGNAHEDINAAMDANVAYSVKRAVGEINKVAYEGQHITATNTIEENLTALHRSGSFRSAVLSGLTLVNELNITSFSEGGSASYDAIISKDENSISVETVSNGSLIVIFNDLVKQLKQNTKYLLIGVDEFTGNSSVEIGIDDGSFTQFTNVEKVKNVYTFQTSSNVDAYKIFFGCLGVSPLGLKLKIRKPILIEYQDGMENWDIPYFTGMQSVKMPVLSTVGKNLFDKEAMYSRWWCTSDGLVHKPSNGNFYSILVPIVQNDFYTVSGDGIDRQTYAFLDSEYNFISGGHSTLTTRQKSENAKYILYYISSTDVMNVKNIQFEMGTVATPYEDYKTNILSCLEEVELGGVGGVSDSLDCLKSVDNCELNTESIIVNGTEDWRNSTSWNDGDTIGFYSPNNKSNGVCICDKFIYDKTINIATVDVECVSFPKNAWIGIRILKSKLETKDIDGFKKWLSNNNVEIRYELAQKVVKTVDLSADLLSYNGTTHYDCSAEEGFLIPTLKIDVPTNVNELVANQRDTIAALSVENEELKNGIIYVNNESLNGDLDLLQGQWDIDFRLFMLEISVGAPMKMNLTNNLGDENMSRYQQAKTLILGVRYVRSTMEYQLRCYLDGGAITKDEYDELIALMDARDLVEGN